MRVCHVRQTPDWSEKLEPRRLLSGGAVGVVDVEPGPVVPDVRALIIRFTRYPDPQPVNVPPAISVARDGTLFITGSTSSDRIVVDATMLADASAEHPRIRIRRIRLDARAGNDVVDMRVSLPATIIGGSGNDHITAGGRADHISGGDGSDTIHSGSGDDTVDGLAGRDTLAGDAGADVLLGGADDDWIWGGSGDDTVRGGTGIDMCIGNDGNDLLYGDGGRDMIFGGAGRDRFKCLDGEPDTAHRGPTDERDRVLASDADDRFEVGQSPW